MMKRHLIILIGLVLSSYLMPMQLKAQERITVTGIVLDGDNNGIPGASILTGKPLRSVAATNAKGEFKVVVPNEALIVVRSLSFLETQIKLKPGQKTLTVKLKDDLNEMKEVVVRGYVQRDKEITTGASYTVSGKEVQDVPVANVEQLLQGKVPGLNIQINTGAPGFRGTTQIRGLSTLSITGEGDMSFLQPTSPLYVIDGVPMDADGASDMGFEQQGPGISPLSLIPQEDIESIEVLKDAQATSLYGSLAAYGVIIITTKRGTTPAPRVRYTHNTFIKAPPALRATLGGNLERELKLAQIIYNALDDNDIRKIQSIPFLTDSLNAFYNNSTNWQALYYRISTNQTHNLAIDGGDSKFNYKANLGYFGEKGIIKNTGFNRYTANMRMEFKPNGKLNFVGQINGSLGKQNKGDGLGLFQTGVATGGRSSTLLPGPSFFQASAGYLSALKTVNDNDVRSLNSFIEAGYNFIPGLRASSSLSYNFSTSTEDTFTPAAANNQFARVYAFNGRNNQLYNRNSINFSKTFNEDHNIFFNLFNEFRATGRLNTSIRQERLPNDQFRGPLGFDGSRSSGGGVNAFQDSRSTSFALAGSYHYVKKYVLDLSYRIDGSSGNGFDVPFSKNPSIGLRWNYQKEAFLKDVDWLNSGSLRLSWGVNIMPNGTLDRIYGRYNISGKYNSQQGIGIDFGRIPNPNLKPTTTSQFNLGMGLGLFKGTIDLVYDTYYKKVDNLLFGKNLSNTIAFGTLETNDAGIVNYGHELAVTVRPLRKSSPFGFSVSANGAYNRDVLLKLPSTYGGQYIRFNGSDGQHTVFRVGTETMSNYLRINEGVYVDDNSVPVDPVTGLRYQTNSTFFEGGDPILKDLNGDYVLDKDDYLRTGNAQPLFTGGLSANLSYKNIGLNVYASYSAKRTILNNALGNRLSLMRDPFGSNVVVPLDDIDMWRQPGDVAQYPYAYGYRRVNTIQPFRQDQTLWAEDGSYLKINNIVLSYSFDKRLVRTVGLEGFRIYLSAANIITFSRYSGPNPENVTSMGRDVSDGYPVPRTYNVGINIEF